MCAPSLQIGANFQFQARSCSNVALLHFSDEITDGFDQWKRDIGTLARCHNVRAQISGIECIFGMDWTVEKIRTWILTLLELFGANRTMFGSHMPIAGLSTGFEHLYAAYEAIVAGFSPHEQDQMFRKTAADWFELR